MSPRRAHGQIRRSQVITTYGPGALIDLPRHSGIVAGLDTWPNTVDLEQIIEPRLTAKLALMTDVSMPRLFAPPPDPSDPRDPAKGITGWRFPEWCVVREPVGENTRQRSRRLVNRKSLDERGRFDGNQVVATRFVRACPRGHVDDVGWHWFVHGTDTDCPRTRQLWLDETGTTGDLIDLVVRCECKKSRPMFEATIIEDAPLGICPGSRPWLGRHANEECSLPSRLLIRTASNAYFPQVLSVLSLPERGSEVQAAVTRLWDDLQIVNDIADLNFLKRKTQVFQGLEGFDDSEVMDAISYLKSDRPQEIPVRQAELEAILAAPEGFGDDIPVDPDFHARRLPDAIWRRSNRTDGIETVIQLHRIREILALTGFTRFEPVTPDIQGEYESDVERAQLAIEPQWFPAVENRGEGVFIQLKSEQITSWLATVGVKERIKFLDKGHQKWAEDRNSTRPFPGGPYVLLHTLSHLLIQSLSMRCGYPASSIRERLYTDVEAGSFGLLLYTGSPDADGTLGGLVQEARHIDDHLDQAMKIAALCSNDPICAQHEPGQSMEQRWLHGAACHGCALIAEPSCEMRNDYLDRALVVPALGIPNAAFFRTAT